MIVASDVGRYNRVVTMHRRIFWFVTHTLDWGMVARAFSFSIRKPRRSSVMIYSHLEYWIETVLARSLCLKILIYERRNVFIPFIFYSYVYSAARTMPFQYSEMFQTFLWKFENYRILHRFLLLIMKTLLLLFTWKMYSCISEIFQL